MPSSDCKHFETCQAPLCPMGEQKQNCNHIWYHDEAICKAKEFQSLRWIQKQKLIAKKHGSVEGFFTVEMLNAIERVSKGIVGAEPDVPLEKRADLKWIKDLRAAQRRMKKRRTLASATQKTGRTSKLRNEHSGTGLYETTHGAEKAEKVRNNEWQTLDSLK